MKRVVVGMSGGVDSSVAAQLLLSQGYDVVGLFMHNWEEESEANGACMAADDWADVQAVCGKLGIPCYSVNFSEEYMRRVFEYFLDEYKKGRTPNPDVLCNREIKFGPFKEYARRLGADCIATGHYCALQEGETGAQLYKPVDYAKDQTYFLNQVRTQQLQNVLFPLSHLSKAQVRALAEQHGLVTARKKDSTGICFIGERNFKKFLMQYLPAQAGDILDTAGKKVGRHSGLMYYTLGQRRGLGIGGVSGEGDARWYVVQKDLKNNVLVVNCGEGEELLSDGCILSDVNYIGGAPTDKQFDCFVKLRYRQPEQRVRVCVRSESSVRLEFCERQRAVTPGQYGVLYDSGPGKAGRCLGGGVIERTF